MTYLTVVAVLSILIVGILLFKISQEVLTQQAKEHALDVARLTARVLQAEDIDARAQSRLSSILRELKLVHGMHRWALFTSRGELLMEEPSRTEDSKLGVWIPPSGIDKEGESLVEEGDQVTVYVPLFRKKRHVASVGLRFETGQATLGLSRIRSGVISMP